MSRSCSAFQLYLQALVAAEKRLFSDEILTPAQINTFALLFKSLCQQNKPSQAVDCCWISPEKSIKDYLIRLRDDLEVSYFQMKFAWIYVDCYIRGGYEPIYLSLTTFRRLFSTAILLAEKYLSLGMVRDQIMNMRVHPIFQ